MNELAGRVGSELRCRVTVVTSCVVPHGHSGKCDGHELDALHQRSRQYGVGLGCTLCPSEWRHGVGSEHVLPERVHIRREFAVFAASLRARRHLELDGADLLLLVPAKDGNWLLIVVQHFVAHCVQLPLEHLPRMIGPYLHENVLVGAPRCAVQGY